MQEIIPRQITLILIQVPQNQAGKIELPKWNNQTPEIEEQYSSSLTQPHHTEYTE